MRPVNLIPAEQRRGQGGPARTGRLAPYLIVGFLLAALAGTTVLVLSNNQISERKAEIAELKREQAELKARADRLAAYTDFRGVRETRTTTIASLADSRFDWERVLRELALIIPADVWLVEASGTVTPAVQLTDGVEISARESVPGPALELVGCAPSQEAVARFVAALDDIDGATRVGVATSQLPEPTPGDAPSTGSNVDDEDCRTRDFIARFEIVVAFDEVTAGLPSPTPAPSTGAPVSSESSGDVNAEQAAADGSAGAQVQQAPAAVDSYVK